MKEYILYVDDTRFNANEKNSEVLKQEHGTCAGVLIEKGLAPHLTVTMIGLSSFLNRCYGTNSISQICIIAGTSLKIYNFRKH